MITKETLAQQIAEKNGTTKKLVRTIIDDVFDSIIAETAKEDGKVSISGFGTFAASVRKERQCKNPQTGETMTVEARRVPHFKAGQNFKNQCMSADE